MAAGARADGRLLSALTGGDGDRAGAVSPLLLLQVLRQAQLRGERGRGRRGRRSARVGSGFPKGLTEPAFPADRRHGLH